MEEVNGTLSLYEQATVTNKSIVVTFSPGDTVVRYTYILYKNNEETERINVNNSNTTDIRLSGSGKYNLVINVTHEDGTSGTLKSGYYLLDQEAPVINVNSNVISIKKGESFNPFDYFTVYDDQDGNMIDKVITNYDSLDLNSVGVQSLTISVTDSALNEATKRVIVNIKKNNDSTLFIYQGIFCFLILIVIGLVVWYRKRKKRFERVSKYAVESIDGSSPNIIDKLFNGYLKFLNIIVVGLKSFEVLKKIGKKYNKYLVITSKQYKNGMQLIANKIVFGIMFVLIIMFSKMFLGSVINPLEGILYFILGFYILDIKYIILYNKYREHLENDLLQAIVIMNNCFKAGCSITQAISIVGNEMDGIIASEYRQMYAEIKFGLSLEEVFKRFSDRINLREASYISASLSILNKTGGNIVKIFDAIEKTLFNKKKVKNEYKALTGSPKLISNFLFVLPIIFVVLIIFISPDYFVPMFKSIIGICLLVVALILYIIYIWIIKKTFKIRM